MNRPTVSDLAKAAGVSRSTVDRILNAREPVRPLTTQQVLDAAEAIGFYGRGAIRDRLQRTRSTFKVSFLLQYPNSSFYKILAHEIRSAAATFEPAKLQIDIEFAPDPSPETAAEFIVRMGKKCDVLAVVAPQHHSTARAIERLRENGIPTFALIGELSAQCSIGYIGLDNWQIGRTAAWVFANICKAPGKLALLVGNSGYRNQERNEIGFRSYFREKNTAFEILEPLGTWGDDRKAEELTHQILDQHPDLAGLYVAGGGVTGAVKALRNRPESASLVTLGYQISDETRAALRDGILNVVISYPMKYLARETLVAMSGAIGRDPEYSLPSISMPLDIFTPENI